MYVLIFIATITVNGITTHDTSDNYHRGANSQYNSIICNKQANEFNLAHRGSSISAACVYLPNHG